LGFEFVGVDASKAQKHLVERTIEVVFAVFAVDGGAAFIQRARQQGVTAQADAAATGRTLC
jgi:hypothetical protein